MMDVQLSVPGVELGVSSLLGPEIFRAYSEPDLANFNVSYE
jgi:hypothetical protein